MGTVHRALGTDLVTTHGDLTPGERVSITYFIHREPEYLDGWITSITPEAVTISDCPDDDGADDYDTDSFMRATFDPRHVFIYRTGKTGTAKTTTTKENQ